MGWPRLADSFLCFQNGSACRRYVTKRFSTHLVWSTENINKVDSYLRAAITHCRSSSDTKEEVGSVTALCTSLIAIPLEHAAALTRLTRQAFQPSEIPLEIPVITIEDAALTLPKLPKQNEQLRLFEVRIRKRRKKILQQLGHI